ncbi:hypothetical protein EJB05_28258 [Eragrostis curvula]|uniref:Uncharacterized protein n=1 Tax=Eragrostis curvula TaxID=38414 RepID=A0A5J9UR46_9POAL|nr:hypothetical protein EJB05_28258 [Eragrostis curvula]
MSRAPRLCLSPPLIGHPRPRTSTRRPHRPRPWTSPHRPQCRPLARQLVLSYRPATKIDRKMAPGRKLGTSKRTPAGNREKVVIQQKTGSDLIASLCIAKSKDKYKDVPAIPIDLFKECHCSSKTVLTKPVKKAIAT